MFLNGTGNFHAVNWLITTMTATAYHDIYEHYFNMLKP